MPRSISLQTLEDQKKAVLDAIEKQENLLHVVNERIKATKEAQERSQALKIGYLALSFGLKASNDEELAETEAFLKLFAHKTA